MKVESSRHPNNVGIMKPDEVKLCSLVLGWAALIYIISYSLQFILPQVVLNSRSSTFTNNLFFFHNMKGLLYSYHF